jgi:hypothetical protein
MIFLAHYRAIKKTTGIDAVEIIGDETNWVATLVDGSKITEKDVNKKAIADEAKAIDLEVKAKVAQRQAIADRLGLTADELKVLLG